MSETQRTKMLLAEDSSDIRWGNCTNDAFSIGGAKPVHVIKKKIMVCSGM